MLKSMLLVICLIGCLPTAFADVDTGVATILKLKETIQASKTVGDFVRRLPGDTSHLQRFLKRYAPEVYAKNFEAASYDVNAKWLKVGKQRFDFSQIAKGSIGLSGKQFSYSPQFFEFYAQAYLKLPQGSGLAWHRFLLDDARAQNRDAFPELQSVAKREDEKTELNLDELVYLPLMGLSVFKYKPVKAIGRSIARTAIPTLLMYWALNYAHAHAAPSCAAQIKELQDALAEGKIGLAEFSCGNTVASRAKISFWTPDKQNLPFVADWTTNQLWVNRDEVYQFDKKKLISVEIEKGDKQLSITKGSPEYFKYRNHLEPYRKVLATVGSYNSCYKCESEIAKALVKEKPTEDEASPASAPDVRAAH